MGDIADDMIDGHSCSWCGIYFEQPHLFAVICNSCAQQVKGMTTNQLLDKHGVQRSQEKEAG